MTSGLYMLLCLIGRTGLNMQPMNIHHPIWWFPNPSLDGAAGTIGYFCAFSALKYKSLIWHTILS